MNKKIFMWVLIPVVILVIVLTIVMLKGKEDVTKNEVGNANDESQTNENNNVGNNNDNENKIDYKTWGVADQFAAENDGPAESFYINFPNYGGTSHGYALIADQSNDTAALISGQNDYAPKISGISELFPAYFDQLEYTLQKRYGLRASNFKLTLTDNAPVVIGDYDMHTFTGNIAFDYEGVSKDYKFVAYATTLKSNGAYAYWVVYDTSDNQSNGKLIKEHAYNMAKTFREKE